MYTELPRRVTLTQKMAELFAQHPGTVFQMDTRFLIFKKSQMALRFLLN